MELVAKRQFLTRVELEKEFIFPNPILEIIYDFEKNTDGNYVGIFKIDDCFYICKVINGNRVVWGNKFAPFTEKGVKYVGFKYFSLKQAKTARRGGFYRWVDVY